MPESVYYNESVNLDGKGQYILRNYWPFTYSGIYLALP